MDGRYPRLGGSHRASESARKNRLEWVSAPSLVTSSQGRRGEVRCGHKDLLKSRDYVLGGTCHGVPDPSAGEFEQDNASNARLRKRLQFFYAFFRRASDSKGIDHPIGHQVCTILSGSHGIHEGLNLRVAVPSTCPYRVVLEVTHEFSKNRFHPQASCSSIRIDREQGVGISGKVIKVSACF